MMAPSDLSSDLSTGLHHADHLGFRSDRAAKGSRHSPFADIVCFTSLLSADVIAICLAGFATLPAIWLAGWIGLEPRMPAVGVEQLYDATPELAVIGTCALIYFVVTGHYTKRLPFWTEMRTIIEISLFALLATSFMEFAFRSDNSRQVLAGTWIMFAALSASFRYATKRALDAASMWQLKVVVIGGQSETDDACDALESERLLGYRIVGIVRSDQLPAVRARDFFRVLLKSCGARRIVLAVDVSSDMGRSLVKEVVLERVPFSLIPQIQGVPVFSYEQSAFFSHDTVMLSYHNALAQPFSRMTKATFDIVVASLLVALFMIPMAVISILIRLDGGNVLFWHERIGAGGRTFRCLKFRTMVMDADRVLRELLAVDPAARAEWAENQKLARDPRVTPVGRFLRATSLDELPQLFNVLRLEMSLVGPRPIVRQEIERYGDDIAFYCETRPGLTGLWQVSGRSNTTYSRRVQLDSWYVRNWSVWHDVAILVKTIPAVIGRSGAR